jgi:hypothetical protein
MNKDPTPQQCASAVLMIRPAAFDYNPETAATNKMQKRRDAQSGVQSGAQSGQAQALSEFDQCVQALRGEGVTVCAVDDTPTPPKPDAIFPNNWVSFHEDGTVVLYPMQSASRRPERRQEILDTVTRELSFKPNRLVDLTRFETQGKFLEGTGSLVLDHSARIAYACLSPRTHPEVVTEWARALQYETVVFGATNAAGVPLYHTNVLMCIGARAVVVGTEAIVPADRARVLKSLQDSGREVIEIGNGEVGHFAGNMLELGTWDEALGDSRVLVMSESARRALKPATFAQLSGCTDAVLAVPIPTIERLGGGSVRCMLAEVFRAT